jgi:Tfp pilus assembly protein PilX
MKLSMQRPHRLTTVQRQRGVTSLFVTLIVLLVMMVLGVTAALLSGTQFKLASNLQAESIAFNLAEGSTNVAQGWLVTGTNFRDEGFTTYSSGTTPQLYPIGSYPAGVDPAVPAWETKMTWTDANSVAIDGDATKRYFIQKLATCQSTLGSTAGRGGRRMTKDDRADLFRITSRGTSVKGTVKVLQTTYTVPIKQAEIDDGYCGPLP